MLALAVSGLNIIAPKTKQNTEASTKRLPTNLSGLPSLSQSCPIIIITMDPRKETSMPDSVFTLIFSFRMRIENMNSNKGFVSSMTAALMLVVLDSPMFSAKLPRELKSIAPSTRSKNSF